MPEEKSRRYQDFYQIIRSIPKGKVATYGQIARLAGYPQGARQVGYALYSLKPAADVPWQRVINSKGEISYSEKRHGHDHIQRKILEKEGIEFDSRGRIDLRKYGWGWN